MSENRKSNNDLPIQLYSNNDLSIYPRQLIFPFSDRASESAESQSFPKGNSANQSDCESESQILKFGVSLLPKTQKGNSKSWNLRLGIAIRLIRRVSLRETLRISGYGYETRNWRNWPCGHRIRNPVAKPGDFPCIFYKGNRYCFWILFLIVNRLMSEICSRKTLRR